MTSAVTRSADHLGGLSDSEPGPRRAVGPRKTLRRRSLGTGPGFAHFCTQKASSDKAVTSGNELSGLEFAGFSGQKTEFGARRLEPVFGGKRANLEAQAPLSTSDTKKRAFRSWPFSALFAPKNGAVTKTGDIGKTFSRLENLAVLQGLGTKKPNELGCYKLSFLTTSCAACGAPGAACASASCASASCASGALSCSVGSIKLYVVKI